MVMTRVSPRLMMKRAEPVARNREPAGHAEMHHQNLIRRQGERQEFRLAPEMRDLRAGKPFGEPLRNGKSEIGAILDHALDPLSLHDRRKAAANCLDFG